MRSNKKWLLLGCVIVLLASLFLTGCAERNDWKKAQQTNTLDSYQKFLKNYPSGKYVEKAKLAIDELEWSKVDQTKMLGDYLTYLKKYPKGIHIAQAKAEANKLMIPKGKDGALMVLIPEGEFEMGSNGGADDEKPVHKVFVKAFYMDVYEVTNAQYLKFVNEMKYKPLKHANDPKMNMPDQPVVNVTWYDAVEYCKWAGKRLPTEAEWEKASRGGLVGKKYPWGETLFHDNANYYDTGGKDFWDTSSKVGDFPPNGYGLYDMSGNAQEWCSDFYDANYYSVSPKDNPTGPKSGKDYVSRGGSWGDDVSNDKESGLRVAKRRFLDPYGADPYTGFRCVMDK
ncbi:MAG: Formylglycine-rating enzyme family protein [Candidatus Poribacteria bacterium]|nr:Formylglycine-rating enzyme family protein [Candidatus Poribacteria bacterium]